MKYNLVLTQGNDHISAVYVRYNGGKLMVYVDMLADYQFVEYSKKAAYAMANILRQQTDGYVMVLDTDTLKRTLINQVLTS